MHGDAGRDPLRDRLAIPVAIGIFALWLIAGFVSLITDDVRVFLIANGPFAGVWGYIFSIGVVRRARNGEQS